jgi:presenilin-like A22 family membrane protease
VAAAETAGNRQGSQPVSELKQSLALLGLAAGVYFLGAIGAKWIAAGLVVVGGSAFISAYVFEQSVIVSVPDWIVLNCVSILFAFYIAISTAEVLPTWGILVVMALFTIFDYKATQQSDTMSSFLGMLVRERLPGYIIIPGTTPFSFSKFQSYFEKDESGDGDVGYPDCKILGIGDLVLPTALAMSLSLAVPSPGFVSPLSIGVALGGLAGLLVVVLRNPKEFSALVVIIPGAFIGLIGSVVVTGAQVQSLLPPGP